MDTTHPHPESPTSVRLPDVFMIGAAKSGTTSLYAWLAMQPEVFEASEKEPAYFAWPERRGFAWYSNLYAGAAADQLVIDASTIYTRPGFAERAAAGIAERCPHARVIYVVRHPLARLRSQYRFDRRRGKIRGALESVVGPNDDKYVERSLYFRCLQPYIERFSRDQFCVVRFEDLVAGGGSGWDAVLAHIGLHPRPRPSADVLNATADRPRHSSLPRRLVGRRPAVYRRLRPLIPVPRGSRARVERMLGRAGRADRDLEAARAPLPPTITAMVWEDAARLADWLGVAPLWDATSDGNDPEGPSR